MIYKVIQITKSLIILPIRLLLLPAWFIIGVVATDWEDKDDRDFFWESIKRFYKPW